MGTVNTTGLVFSRHPRHTGTFQSSGTEPPAIAEDHHFIMSFISSKPDSEFLSLLAVFAGTYCKCTVLWFREQLSV